MIKHIGCGITPFFLVWLTFSPVIEAQSTNGVGKHFDKVVIVVLENERTPQAMSDPSLSQLAKQEARFPNYYALAHPSFPNYLALVAGNTCGHLGRRGGSDFKSNMVLAVLLCDVVNRGRYSDEASHFSLLRTIEDNFGLAPMSRGDRDADPLPEKVWRN